ncbi:hypothetical protein K6119_00880 [Paracrocinitomix mangrovi]|uniref:hypothetical protein n=1 Tax=Paracrocinitomix mangrovi TaxID=2862509 RepID=UPI001C8E3AFC|nr:hypothetical protein [Paracrocinitomix mangrovi]UKN02068.1 hypothetical protein K6119_00880 [Paracrocinitomix mangrovi]
MKVFKPIIYLDAALSFIIPLMAVVYLIYDESDYSVWILLGGWIMFLLHGVAIILTAPSRINTSNSIWATINLVLIGVLFWTDFISFEGFLILELASETVSYLLAILGFVALNKKINGKPFWKELGPGIAIMNLLLISVIVYPFVAEWLLYVNSQSDGTFYWLAISLATLVSVSKKFGVLAEVVQKVNSKPKTEISGSAENTVVKKEVNTTPLFVVFMIIWFVGLIVLMNLK